MLVKLVRFHSRKSTASLAYALTLGIMFFIVTVTYIGSMGNFPPLDDFTYRVATLIVTTLFAWSFWVWLILQPKLSEIPEEELDDKGTVELLVTIAVTLVMLGTGQFLFELVMIQAKGLIFDVWMTALLPGTLFMSGTLLGMKTRKMK